MISINLTMITSRLEKIRAHEGVTASITALEKGNFPIPSHPGPLEKAAWTVNQNGRLEIKWRVRS